MVHIERYRIYDQVNTIEAISTNIIQIICLEKLGGQKCTMPFAFSSCSTWLKDLMTLLFFQWKCGTFSVNDSSEHFSSRG